MTLLAPLALGLGAAAAVLAFALHLITTRRPPPAALPTARFVPISEARAVARVRTPTDLLLLALRALAVLLVAAAFARPVFDAPGPRVRAVVLLDVSRAVADPGAARAAARGRSTAGGVLVRFDTAAREVPLGTLEDPRAVDGAAPDVAVAEGSGAARGALSPALLAGLRAAARVARGADSVRLVIVSPVTTDALDAATPAIRAAWPGGIELVRVRAAVDSAASPAVRLVSSRTDDPIAPALALLPPTRGAHEVRVVREAPSPADSVWGREAARVLVHWPAGGAAPLVPDGVFATGPGAVTVVAPFERLPMDADGRVIARWRDGAPAAVERPLGRGCVREVGIGVSVAGDLTLRPAFVALLARLVEPCGGRRAPPVPDSSLAWLRGAGGAAPARPLAALSTMEPSLGAWLLAAALVLLVVEWLLRRRRRA